MRFIVIGLMLCLSSAFAGDVYVATDGDDGNSGKLNSPYRTIEKAVSELDPGETCYIRGGTYHEEVIGASLQGTAGNPITITNYDGEQVTLDGSESLADLGGATWSVYSGDIYTTTINKDIWQLWVDGRMAITARWPNANTHPCDPIVPQLKADGYTPKDGSWWDWDGTWGHMIAYDPNGILENSSFYQTVPNVSFAGGSIILNYHSETTFSRPIDSHDAGSNIIRHTPVVNPHDQKPNGHFLVEAMSALDQAGEWYYDKNTGEVRLWCEDGQTPQGSDVRGKTISCALDFQNIKYVNIIGIDFFGCTINFPNAGHTNLEDCNFDYPSMYPRMIGTHSYAGESGGSAAGQPPQYGATYFRGGNGGYNVMRDCVFRYSDGPIEAKNNDNALFENCLFSHFNFTGMGLMVMMANGSSNALTDRCTFHVNGSKVMQKHTGMSINMSRSSFFGYLQQDGCAWQCAGGNGPGGGSDGTVRSYLWHHQAWKTGVRWDGDDGINGSDHHEVSMLVPASQNIKGDYHKVISNTSVALHDPGHPGIQLRDPNPVTDPKNQNSHCYNNLGDSISSDSSAYVPLTCINSNNWNGYVDSTGPTDMARDRLRDPLNLDFRPKPGADIIDAGIAYAPITNGYIGSAPDIGAYEYGDTHYWIPGYQSEKASTPIPPNGTITANPSCDLMWLAGNETVSHDIYFGTESGNLPFQGNQPLLDNIFDPNAGDLTDGQTYYWRIDTVTSGGTITGDEWSFTVKEPLETVYVDIAPIADTYVRDDQPTNNFGSSTVLSLATHEDGYEREGYMKFNIDVPGTIISAMLNLYATGASTSGNIQVYSMTDTSWDEYGMTYNNKPPIDGILLDQQDISSLTYRGFHVTDAVTGNGIISFGLDRAFTTSYRGISSRENANPPYLTIAYTVSGGGDLPPEPPANLSAVGSVQQIALDWDANTEPDLDGYQVLRRQNPDDNFAQIHAGLLTTSSYIDTTMLTNLPYEYIVKAADTAGQYSNQSNVEIAYASDPDMNSSGKVEFGDFAVIAEFWQLACSVPTWCDGADLDFSEDVDLQDMMLFVQYWLD
ncbi:MAG: DNRLRE domain-containing protein [Phycisphaerae bacterium]|nr:DNRLRE domain-containing protein [Phycisphaerae bacterium]